MTMSVSYSHIVLAVSTYFSHFFFSFFLQVPLAYSTYTASLLLSIFSTLCFRVIGLTCSNLQSSLHQKPPSLLHHLVLQFFHLSQCSSTSNSIVLLLVRLWKRHPCCYIGVYPVNVSFQYPAFSTAITPSH